MNVIKFLKRKLILKHTNVVNAKVNAKSKNLLKMERIAAKNVN